MTETAAANRLDRRKARTRAALVAAARELLAPRDPAEVSIQEITDTADVGFGSFYNHFESKADLFDSALEDVLEEHGALFDALTPDMEYPAAPSWCIGRHSEGGQIFDYWRDPDGFLVEH